LIVINCPLFDVIAVMDRRLSPIYKYASPPRRLVAWVIVCVCERAREREGGRERERMLVTWITSGCERKRDLDVIAFMVRRLSPIYK